MNKNDYKKMLTIVKKITNDDERAQDLMHDVLIQLNTNGKYNLMDEKERLYFFVRAVKNQFYSNSSLFVRKYKKYSFEELKENFDIEDDIYLDKPDLIWVQDTLKEEVEKNPDFWYKKGIFELWLKHNGFVERVHKQTMIPRYEIKDVVENIKLWLNQKWKQEKDAKH